MCAKIKFVGVVVFENRYEENLTATCTGMRGHDIRTEEEILLS
jgi:hypothetical protein